MRNTNPTSLSELATWVAGTVALVAVATFPLLGMAGMSGQDILLEASNAPLPVTEAVRAVDADDAAGLGLSRLLSDWTRSVTVGGCYNCNPCGILKDKHEIKGNPPPGREGYEAPHDEDCNDNGDCQDHGACNPSFAMGETLQQINNRIRTASPAVLAAVVGRHGDWLSLNQNRQALQLSGCGGSIVASYPVTTLPALQALLQ